MIRLRFLSVVFGGLLLSCSLFSQSANDRKVEVNGIVKDSSGGVVPGAAVRLMLPDGTQVANTKSDGLGAFRLAPPASVDLLLEIKHDGFKPFTQLIHPSGKQLKTITASLQIADLAQREEVTSGAESDGVSTDPAENKDAAVVSSGALERLPVFDQDYVGTLSNFLDQGSVGTRDATIVVDGMEQKDAGVTPSAVQSVKINNDPYSAEYSRPGRGRIEITTKTPSPAYHGTLNAIFRDYHLDARNAFATIKPPEQRRVFEGVLTGPLAKSKSTFFLLSADYKQDNIQSIVFAQLPTGLFQQNVPSPVRSLDLAARLMHNFSDTHTVTLQFTYEGNASRNQLPSSSQNSTGQNSTGQGQGGGGSNRSQPVGGYVLAQAGRDQFDLERHVTFSDKLVLSPSLLNQFQIMFERNRNSTGSNTDAPQIVVQNAFVAGGAQATQLLTENNVDIRDAATWSRGAHTVVAGFSIPNMSRRGLDDHTNRLGTFNFASLQDYVDERPYSFTQQQGPNHFVYWQKEVGFFVQDQIRLSSNLLLGLGLRWDWQNHLHDDNNFAPRASLAYAFGEKRQTVFRTGAGFFYDRTNSRPLGSLALYSAPALTSILLLNPTYPDPFADGISLGTQPPNIYRFSPNIKTPYLILYSAGLERQVFKSATLSATYRGTLGVSLFESLNVNQPLAPFYLVRPLQNYGVYQQVQSAGRQVGQALDLSFSGKANRFLSGLAQYTLSQTKNNTAGINYLPPNSYDLSGEYGRADYDARHRLNLLMTSTLTKWLEFGTGLTASSGLPYTLTLGEDVYHSGQNSARPAGVRRNTLQGPGSVELDLRWSHDFMLTRQGDKGPLITFAADAFNVANHVNYSQFIGNERSPFFGQAVSALPARRLQFTLRFKF